MACQFCFPFFSGAEQQKTLRGVCDLFSLESGKHTFHRFTFESQHFGSTRTFFKKAHVLELLYEHLLAVGIRSPASSGPDTSTSTRGPSRRRRRGRSGLGEREAIAPGARCRLGEFEATATEAMVWGSEGESVWVERALVGRLWSILVGRCAVKGS